MRVTETALGGALLLEPDVHGDSRGFFLQTYHREDYRRVGLDAEFVQDNHSRSRHGTLRGLHYQRRPGQAKLVRVARGAIWDVIVDIRPRSPTFGRFKAYTLDDESHRQLFVPIGFAHGFCVTSDVADVTYKVTSFYDAAEERGIAWDDPDLAIPWPVAAPIVSSRDEANPVLRDVTDL